METETKYSCSAVCQETCQKGGQKCPSECKCATGCQCCTESVSTPNHVQSPLGDSDKKCTCKTDGICTCPEGACECK